MKIFSENSITIYYFKPENLISQESIYKWEKKYQHLICAQAKRVLFHDARIKGDILFCILQRRSGPQQCAEWITINLSHTYTQKYIRIPYISQSLARAYLLVETLSWRETFLLFRNLRSARIDSYMYFCLLRDLLFFHNFFPLLFYQMKNKKFTFFLFSKRAEFFAREESLSLYARDTYKQQYRFLVSSTHAENKKREFHAAALENHVCTAETIFPPRTNSLDDSLCLSDGTEDHTASVESILPKPPIFSESWYVFKFLMLSIFPVIAKWNRPQSCVQVISKNLVLIL